MTLDILRYSTKLDNLISNFISIKLESRVQLKDSIVVREI